MIRRLLIFIIAMLAVKPQGLAQTTPMKVDRPPQYILLAFDGSLNLGMWDDTLTFAKDNNIKFTYFISGVYFLLESEKGNYIEPTHGTGVSAIGWGGSSQEKIRERVAFVNQAHDSGHEIGSHANGHFNGSSWSLAAWQSEFSQFYELIFNVFSLNKIDPTPGLNPFHFVAKDIKGFRAPYLGTNKSLYKTLQDYNYGYDTSQTAPMTYWPEKINGLWNFPLAQVRISGTGRRTLSMDYNFYFAQSRGEEDPAHYQKYKDEMLNTYMGYFHTNYYGNRAPIHIGHHFSKWNGGAYWDALKDFARKVCVLPEVQCISYGSLQKIMDQTPSTILADYRDGNFEKKAPGFPFDIRQSIDGVAPKDLKLVMKYKEGTGFYGSIRGKDRAEILQLPIEYIWKSDNKVIANSKTSWLPISIAQNFLHNSGVLTLDVVSSGREMLRSSHVVTLDEDDSVVLSPEDLEDRALAGDLPEAHQGEKD